MGVLFSLALWATAGSITSFIAQMSASLSST
jgi:hypothetical protein